jgi:RNA polymerase sigma factor (sigma-70 family)
MVETATMRAPETLSDRELVARCRRGDDAAWAALVERYARYVHAIAVRAFGLTGGDAEDVFQEAFARTYEHLDRLRDDDAIRPWLASTTRRLAIDRLRGAGREGPAEEPAFEPADPDDVIARLDDALSVRAGLARLPEHCREILDRFFARDESYKTIAAALDIASGTIASRISRCLRKLREEFEGRSPAAPPS